MSATRQKLREVVLQLLYSHNLYSQNNPTLSSESQNEAGISESLETKQALIDQQNETLALLSEQLNLSEMDLKLAHFRLEQILSKQAEIDQRIAQASSSYELNRIHQVDLNTLRLGVYELIFDDSIPPKVAMAEAIRLAKKFGTPESTSFVNAILDNIYKSVL